MNWQPRPSTRAQRVERQQVLDRAHGQCQIRGPNCARVATIDDHIVPRAEGGTEALTNRQAACTPCHHEKTQQEAIRGRARVTAKLTHRREPHPGRKA